MEGEEPEDFCGRSCQPVGECRSHDAVGIGVGNQWTHECSRRLTYRDAFKICAFVENFQCLLLPRCSSPVVPLWILLCFSFLHCTLPGPPWKESSAIILERVALVQLCGLREKLVVFFFIGHFLKLHLSVSFKFMGRHRSTPQFKKT